MTIEEINEELQQRFVKRAALNETFGLTRADQNKPFGQVFAKTGVIAILLYAVAAAMWAKDRLFSTWIEDVESTARATRYGTYDWWVKTAKSYQDGDQTVVTDSGVGYEVIDETKQIVKAATIVQDGRNLTIKVAKMTGGSLAPLSSQELQRFKGYVQNVKPIGIVCNVLSGEAARVKLVATVFYNAEKSVAEIESEVVDAVNNYLANVGFGGVIYKSRMLESMLSVSGVIDVVIFQCLLDGVSINPSAVPASGYAVLSDVTLDVRVAYDRGR